MSGHGWILEEMYKPTCTIIKKKLRYYSLPVGETARLWLAAARESVSGYLAVLILSTEDRHTHGGAGGG